jgi:hypothetical protein
MAFLDPVNTISTKTIVPGVVDGVFRNSPLLAFLRSNSLEPYEGGPSWQFNILYDVMNGGAYNPGETFDISQVQVATGTTITPRYYNVPVSAYVEKLKIEMAGPKAVFDHIELLMQAAALTMSARLTNDLYRHGQNATADRTKNINGLVEALNDGSTNGFLSEAYTSYLTLTRSTVNGALDSPMTGPAASLGNLSYDKLEESCASVTIGPESPDLLITSNKGWSYIKMVFQSQQRFETVDPDFWFHTIKFNGARILPDQYCPGSRTASAVDTKLGYAAYANSETLWLLNTKYLHFWVSTDDEFGFGFTGFLPAQQTSVVAGHYKFAGNFAVSAPRLMRVHHGITG